MNECTKCNSIYEELKKVEDEQLLHKKNMLEGKELNKFMNRIKRKNILIGIVVTCIIFGSIILGHNLYYYNQEKQLIGTWTTSQGDELVFDKNQNLKIEAVECADTLEDGDAYYMIHMNNVLRVNQEDNSIEFMYKISSGKLHLKLMGKDYMTLIKKKN